MKYLLSRCAPALAATLTLTLVCAGARAETPQTPDYSDWYQVEIIVFAQNNPTPSDEIWPTPDLEYPENMLAIAPASAGQLKPPDLAELQQLLATAQAPHGQAAETAEVAAVFNAHLPVAFRALPNQSLHLNTVARRIERSSMYRMLLHTGWLQPIGSEGDSYPVLIQTGNRYANAFEVDGTLTMSRARYLHVDTDLWFTQFAQKYDEQLPLPAIVSNMDPATRRKYPDLVAAEEKGSNFAKVQTYRMHLSRRMRSATLHYLDNPYFGVLIEVDEFNHSPPDAAQSNAPTSSPGQ